MHRSISVYYPMDKYNQSSWKQTLKGKDIFCKDYW